MTKHFYPILLLLIISCAGTPNKKTTEIPRKPDIQEKPETPVLIMGQGKVSAENLSAFLLRSNEQIDPVYLKMLSLLYIEEASFEGVNHDVAFAQMCLETGFLKFGGLVTPDMNNFCGLGSTGLRNPDGSIEKGLSFPDSRTGVRAHIQHLKAYATDEPLKLALVDPRYRFVRLGSSPEIYGLAGTWAADRQYAVKINDILQRLYDFSF